ncbi:MAG TPA: hypothetical protein VGN32_12065 [Ktedonobacterales bacterium]|jgi:hypothetical protein|nr:hypothetical protein [Ktedonobacterales bacterium]
MFDPFILADFSVQTASVLLASAVGVVLVAAVLLVWATVARRAYSGPETVIFARSPLLFIIGALVTAVCIGGAAFVYDPSQQSGIFVGLILVGLFAVVLAGQFLMPALTFWVADHSGLTRQFLAFKTTLPWHTIDWVYPASKTTTYRTYGIKTGQSTQQSLMIEAGPKRKLKLTIKAFGVGGDTNALVEATRQRATNALFGYDKYPTVQQRRTGGVASAR